MSKADKRARQKANRDIGRAERDAMAQRDRRKRAAMRSLVMVLVAVGVAALLAWRASSGDDNKAAKKDERTENSRPDRPEPGSRPSGATGPSGASAASPTTIAGEVPLPQDCVPDAPAVPDVPRVFAEAPAMTIDPTKNYSASIETSCGTILVDLDAKNAPLTVNNFVFLARGQYYDGLTFHRIGQGFMVQGGDPSGDGTGGPGYQFADELPTDGYQIGSLAMANSGANTNGSQFFIVTGDSGASLPPSYSKFGLVKEGIDVAHKLEAFGPADGSAATPVQTMYIHKITITEN